MRPCRFSGLVAPRCQTEIGAHIRGASKQCRFRDVRNSRQVQEFVPRREPKNKPKVVKIAQTVSWEANVDRFIRAQNVERYRGMLERVTDEIDRKAILTLLAAEQQKQKNAAICSRIKTDGNTIHELRSSTCAQRDAQAPQGRCTPSRFDPDQG